MKSLLRKLNSFKCKLCMFVSLVSFIILFLWVQHLKLQRKMMIENFVDGPEDLYKDSSIFRDKAAEVIRLGKIRKTIYAINEEQIIHNQLFESIDHVTFVIVIQVHDRRLYLLELISSFKNLLGISRLLLIFSHDYFDESLNNLIQQIPFASYMQIFYPFSSQLYPDIFPGNDSKFCQSDWICKAARRERNFIRAQVKNHWWWKANHVFQKLEVLKEYEGYVVFLEEDQYVSEDFVYVLKLLETISGYECPECHMISLGVHRPILSNYLTIRPAVVKEGFGTTPYSMGIAFNRSVWNQLKQYSQYFCLYNDYSWINSLRNLGTHFPNNKLYMFSIEAPRVFHVGKCGIHSYASDCDITDNIDLLKQFLASVNGGLFPRYYRRMTRDSSKNFSVSGFFDDIRDQELCMSFGKSVMYLG